MAYGGFAIGIAVGAGIGVATGEFGHWLAIGVALGFVFSAAMRNKSKPKS